MQLVSSKECSETLKSGVSKSCCTFEILDVLLPKASSEVYMGIEGSNVRLPPSIYKLARCWT